MVERGGPRRSRAAPYGNRRRRARVFAGNDRFFVAARCRVVFWAVRRADRAAGPRLAVDRAGRDVLISAPTGSGKTLAAFTLALDGLVRRAAEGPLPDETLVVYVSPLKALTNDVRKNLETPLSELLALAAERGVELAPIRTARAPATRRRPSARACCANRRTSWSPRRNRSTSCSPRTGRARFHARRGDRRRRDPRAGCRQTRLAPRLEFGAARRSGRRATAARSRNASDCRRRCGRSRRSPPS
jgi:ATP-dependent helicase YprA (DUF1998 family)